MFDRVAFCCRVYRDCVLLILGLLHWSELLLPALILYRDRSSVKTSNDDIKACDEKDVKSVALQTTLRNIGMSSLCRKILQFLAFVVTFALLVILFESRSSFDFVVPVQTWKHRIQTPMSRVDDSEMSVLSSSQMLFPTPSPMPMPLQPSVTVPHLSSEISSPTGTVNPQHVADNTPTQQVSPDSSLSSDTTSTSSIVITSTSTSYSPTPGTTNTELASSPGGTTPTTSVPPTRRPTPVFSSPLSTKPSVIVDRYVSFHGGFADGRGLGNQIFDLAVVFYVAELTGRRPAILRFSYELAIDEVFKLDVERFDDLCPCYVFGEDGSLLYDQRLEKLVNQTRSGELHGQSIFLSGFFQSWKYTQRVERQLRRQLVFKDALQRFADEFLAANIPPGWGAGFVRVGIHVRRGDVLNDNMKKFGYTTPDRTYFERAMQYFVDRYDHIQFIVASNDLTWCRQNFAEFASAFRFRVNVTYSSGHSRGEDLALMASCEHVIMSMGTYGWWAAWLARGTTIYFADWPKAGSDLARKFRRKDFFPPTWIGMYDALSPRTDSVDVSIVSTTPSQAP